MCSFLKKTEHPFLGHSKLFFAPALGYLLIFALFPLALSVYFSFPSLNFSSYIALFEFPELWRVILNTLIFSFGTASISTLLGLNLAILVDSMKRGRRALTLLGYLPYTIPFTASALIWTTIYDPIYGPLNYFLSLLSLPRLNWLGNPSLQIYSATIVSVWSSVPLAFIICLAALRSVQEQIREAAQVDGMGAWHYYTSLALPMSKGAILTAFLMTLIIAFGNFDLPYILNSGYAYSMATLPFLVWFEIFYQNEVAQGLAAGVLLTAFVSVFSILLIRVTTRGGGNFRRRVSLFFRVPDFVFKALVYVVSFVTLVFLLFPVYWMALIATRAQSLDFVNPPLLLPLKLDLSPFVQTAQQAAPYVVTSLAVSLVAMAITVLLASPAAYSVSRFNTKWLLNLSIYLYALPSASFVFGLYFIFYKLNALNTWLALMISAPIFTVPFSTWILSNFLSSLPRHYEEAASVDGYSPFRSFYEIVLPLIRPGLLATMLISFIVSWHLLLVPLVLSQTPYEFNFPPTGSLTVTIFATYFDPNSLGSSVGYNVWPQLASAGVILSLPVIALALYTQEYLLKGLNFATKG